MEPQWLSWAKQLQSIAQAGLTYSKDPFDLERFEMNRDISIDMMSRQTNVSREKIRDMFANETGYATPKVDVRAVVFKEKLLKERRIQMMDKESVIRMWEGYQKVNPQAPEDYDAWAFGDSKEIADELAGLVLEGKKTATASNYILYELEQEALPYVGQFNVIVDGEGKAVAILETTSVDIVPFNEVSEEHAYLEGEGDRSLRYWRDVHEDFFTRELKEINQEFHDQILVACEKLKLVYK